MLPEAFRCGPLPSIDLGFYRTGKELCDVWCWATTLHHNRFGRVSLIGTVLVCMETFELIDRPLTSCHSEDTFSSLIEWDSGQFFPKPFPFLTLFCPLGLVPLSFRLSKMEHFTVTHQSVKLWQKAVPSCQDPEEERRGALSRGCLCST